MPLVEATYRKAQEFLHAIKIGSEVMSKSELIDNKTREAFEEFAMWNINTIKESIGKKDLSSTGLKSLIDAYFTLWNEGVGLDIEEFWNQLAGNDIDFSRKDPLKFALDKGRFRNVHQGMSARKDWGRLRHSKHLLGRYSQDEINRLDEIIKADEITRAYLLKKCLTNRKIPQTQYLRFGDCMGYLGYCGLFDKHFDKNELKELYEIWSNFE